MKSVRFDKDSKKISFAVNDPNIYIELENIIERENGYVEVSLNPKMFTIRIDQFLDLLVFLQSNAENKNIDDYEKDIMKAIKQNLSKESKYYKIIEKENFTFSDFKQLLLENSIAIGLDLIVSTVPTGSYIMKIFSTIFTFCELN